MQNNLDLNNRQEVADYLRHLSDDMFKVCREKGKHTRRSQLYKVADSLAYAASTWRNMGRGYESHCAVLVVFEMVKWNADRDSRTWDKWGELKAALEVLGITPGGAISELSRAEKSSA